MKRNSILILHLGLLLTCQCALAQHEEPVLATVTYQFVHVNDTNNRANPTKTTMILRLGLENSKYKNADLEYQIMDARKSSGAAIEGPARAVSGKPIAVVMSQGVNTEELFQIPKENKLVKTANLGMKDYVIETALPNINWKIEAETKMIGKYSCQKAVGSFGGRIYNAWFTSDLPFRYGPWKLWGLPGLILEAKDSKNEVFFLFKEISKGASDERIFSDRQRPIKVEEETFNRAKKAFEQNPGTAMQSQLGDNSPSVQTFYRDSTGKTLTGEEARIAIKKESKIKNNNPLELTKN